MTAALAGVAGPAQAQNDFGTWLRERQERIDGLLRARLERLVQAAPPVLAEAMRYSLLGGGKRLRPVLCLAFAERASGAGSTEAALPELALDAACALELVHTYSLIHDDLPAMDDDALRRGRPTSHRVFGEALAILAGDALLTEAFSLVAGGAAASGGALQVSGCAEGASVAGELALRARLALELARAAGAGGMVAGQVLDIADDRPAELEYLLALHRRKTGALIRAACRMGVLAGGGGGALLDAAERYGDAVGLAFQIADDCLDVTSSPEVLGKPAGADAASGRATFPAVLGLQASLELAREWIDRAQAAVAPFEGAGGPLAALASYTVDRRT